MFRSLLLPLFNWLCDDGDSISLADFICRFVAFLERENRHRIMRMAVEFK